MSTRWLRRGVMVAGALGALLAGVQDAHASGYLVARFGSDDGTPAMANNYAIYYNPAALSGMKGTQLTGDLSGLMRYVGYTRSEAALSPSDPALKGNQDYVRANSGHNKIINALAIPYVAISSDFGTSWFRAGYAAYIPYGGIAGWNKVKGDNLSPGAENGPQRWHNISGQILTIYNSFAASAKLGGSGLAIGASFSPIIHHVSTVRARNLDGSDDTVGLGGELVEGRSLVSAWGLNFGATFGLYYANKDQSVRVGLSYTSQPGFGTTKMQGTLKQALGTASANDSTDISFFNAYPDLIRLGAATRLHRRWELRGDIEYVRWRTFDKQCVTNRNRECTVDANGTDSTGGQNVILNIPREFKDAVGLRLGPSFMLSESAELFGSVGFSTPAVPKRTIDASTIDALRFYYTLGARFHVSRKTQLGVSYNHIQFMNVDTKGESHQYRYRTADGLPNQSTSPSADGVYKSQVGMLNVNVNYTF